MSFNIDKIVSQFNIQSSVIGAGTGSSDAKNKPNSVWTVEDSSSAQKEKKAKEKKGLRALLKKAWEFLKSILSPNKTAKATADASRHASEAASMAAVQAEQLSNLQTTAQEMMANMTENIEAIENIISNIQTLSENLQEIQARIEELQAELEQKQEALNNTDDPNEREQLLADIQMISGELEGLNNNLKEIQETITNLDAQITELQDKVQTESDNLDTVVKKETESIKKQEENIETKSEEVGKKSAEGAGDAATATTGAGLSAGLEALVPAATVTVVGAGLGAAAQAAAVKTGNVASDRGAASGIEWGDIAANLPPILSTGMNIVMNLGLLNDYRNQGAGFFGSAGNLFGSYDTYQSSMVKGTGSAGEQIMAMITTIGSIYTQAQAEKKDKQA